MITSLACFELHIQRRKAITAMGGRNEGYAYLTAFYDINAANAYFVEEYMEGRITILA